MTRWKREWEVTLFIKETEGDETSTQPWYNPIDIKQLLELSLRTGAKMRDLEVFQIHVDSPKECYIEDEVPF